MSAAVAAAVMAAGLRLTAAHAYAEGAPPGFSGGFKEESCHACHFHAAPNTPPGRVTIDGIPARFAPGERYTLTVTLDRAGMKRAGFQLTARFNDGGGQAGTIAAVSIDAERVQIDRQSGIQYAGQKKAGSAVAEDARARWTIEWVAPPRGGAVVFNVAANAADGNESADGDYIYTASAEAAAPEPAPDASAGDTSSSGIRTHVRKSAMPPN